VYIQLEVTGSNVVFSRDYKGALCKSLGRRRLCRQWL